MMDQTIDRLFTTARTCRVWQKKDVDDDVIHRIYDLAKLGPTHANCCPLRIVFVKSPQAKETLKSTLDMGNVDQTMSAPITAIIGYDPNFHEFSDELYPGSKAWFSDPKTRDYIGLVNGSLQGAYFMLAARLMGVDCGPMAGFDKKKVDELFFKEQGYKSIFLCNLGYGDRTNILPRGPRLEFKLVCDII